MQKPTIARLVMVLVGLWTGSSAFLSGQDLTDMPLANPRELARAMALAYPGFAAEAGIGAMVTVEILVGAGDRVIGTGTILPGNVVGFEVAAAAAAEVIEFAVPVSPGRYQYRLSFSPPAFQPEGAEGLECFPPEVLTAVALEWHQLRPPRGLQTVGAPPSAEAPSVVPLEVDRSTLPQRCSEVAAAWITSPTVRARLLDRGIDLCDGIGCAASASANRFRLGESEMTWIGREWDLEVHEVPAAGRWTVWCNGADCKVTRRPRPIS